jgi:hypothetical protein
MSAVYYSPLSSLMPRDALPEALGFVKDGLTSLLDDIYFKDFQHSSSPRGDAAQYSLTIVTLKALEVEIPGTGIFLVLNPSHTPGGTSEFPITLRWEWGILTWLRAFDPSEFSFAPGDLFQLALTILGLTERQLVERALSVFVSAPNPIDQFVDDVNAEYGTTIPHPAGANPIEEAIDAIDAELGDGAAVAVFAVYVLDDFDLDATEQRLEQLFASFFGGSLKDYFLKLLVPKIDATLVLGAGVRFPRSVLLPLDAIGGNPLPDPAQSMLTFEAGSFFFSTQRGIGYDETLTASLTPSQIGQTGFEIAITGAKLDISRTTNIPEATADGRPEDFVGVFIEEAAIKLPPFFNEDTGTSSAKLTGKKLLIGTGGLSGSIALEALDPDSPTPAMVKGKFGSGFEIGLSAVSVTFQQNAITASEIKGFMKIPEFKDTEGNDAEIQIGASIGSDGSFSVTASEEQAITALRIPDIVDVNIKSLSVGRKDGRFFVAVSGALDFADQGGAIGKFIPDKIEIQKLLIWDDGKIELEGGSLVLPKAATLKIGPVEISITAIHFGTLEQEHNGQPRKYAYFGFDGGISIDPGGVDARGDGIKFYFTTDNGPGKPLHVFLRITSIAIDLVLPGDAKPEEAALLLKGFLSMKDDGAGGTEYIGGVAFALPKMKMAGSAAMRFNPRLPSFLVDAGLELATPIVLGATGLGVYGFRGLVGMRYVAKKSAAGLADDAQWWQYYKAKVPPDNREGIQVSKFAAQQGFSLGAGVSLATVPDAGVAFSSKLFFLLSMPDVFLLQGQGQIIKERVGLDTANDPPFFAMIAITSSSVEAAFGVNYKIPDGGEIAQIDALLEMGFFFGNSSAWYINLGKDQPEDRRVRARLLTLFNSYFYLMLSSGGIRTGAGVAYELKKKIGPFKVDLKASLDMAGQISYRPRQIGGSIELAGELGLRIFGVGFSISASAALSGEAPHPFIVTGKLKACVKIFWSKKCVTVELTWTFDPNLDFAELPLFGPDVTTSIQALNVLTLDTFPVFAQRTATLPSPAALANHFVPLDSYIDIEFRQGVHPNGPHPSLAKFHDVGGSLDYTVLVPPQKAKSTQVRHELFVDSLELLSWNPATSAWQPYDVYAAATPLQVAPFVTADLTTLPFGYWQKLDPARHNKLRVLSLTPFSYMRPGTPDQAPPQDFGVLTEDVFCAPEEIEMECRDFSAALDRGQIESLVPAGTWRSMPDVLYRVSPNGGAIRRDPWQGLDNSLCADEESTIRLLFPEPMARVSLLLHTEGSAVEVTWYRRSPVPNPNGHAPLYEWQVIRVDNVAASALADPVEYDDLDHPVLRADVRGLGCGDDKGPAGTKGDVVGALGDLFNALARFGDLTGKEVELFPDEKGKYKGLFVDSPLYSLERGTEWVRYELLSEKAGLRARITDSRGFLCDIAIDTAGLEAIAWARVREVARLEPVDGTENDFRAQVVLDDGKAFPVQGHSCFPTNDPPKGDPDVRCNVEVGANAKALLAFLDRVVAKGHLVLPNVLIVPEFVGTYDDVFLHGPLYELDATGAKRVLYRATWDRKGGGPLLIRIQDFLKYDCVISLTSEDGSAIAFSEIKTFLDLQPLPGGEEGEVFEFRILALINGKEVWLRGRSCYPLGECHKGCRTCLYRVCWLTVDAANQNGGNSSDDEVQDEADAMVDALSGSIQPIWRPDTFYAMRITTRDRTFRHDDGSDGPTHANTFIAGWRTVGPVGHFHSYVDTSGAVQTLPAYAALEAEQRADEFKLATLQHYLDFPRCYPNADGRLTGAKPIFYAAPRLDLFYVRPYVYEMYRDWDAFNGAEKIHSKLVVDIIDPALPITTPPPPPVEPEWVQGLPVFTLPEVGVINGMIESGDACADVDPVQPIDVTTVFTPPDLQPRKLYTAVFSNLFRRESATAASKHEVHRYVFQTSRYRSFAAQIDSWILEENAGVVIRGAVYDVEVDADAGVLADAAAVLTDPATSSDALKQRFADPFDRLVDGILQLGALEPAATTEFNVIRLRGTPRVLGILIRNPEPFNDPKMPPADLGETVTLSVGGGSTSLFQALHAKDAARVFVSDTGGGMNVPAGTHRFTFQYRRWNGTAWAVQTVAVAEWERS